MPTPTARSAFETRELFRFARVVPPRIIDLEYRARQESELRELLKLPPEERAAWAESVLGGEGVVLGPKDLRYDYLKHLKLERIPTRVLPTRGALRDPERFAALDVRADEDYQADRRGLLRSLFTLRLAKRTSVDAEVAELGRLLDFVESFPELHRVRRPRPLAYPVLERLTPRRNGKRASAGGARQDASDGEDRPVALVPVAAPADHRRVADGLYLLWRARNRRIQELQAELAAAMADALSPKDLEPLPPLPPPPPTKAQAKKARRTPRLEAVPAGEAAEHEAPSARARGKEDDEAAAARAEAAATRARAIAARARRRAEAVRAARARYEKAREEDGFAEFLALPADEVAKYVKGKDKAEVKRTIDMVSGYMTTIDIPPKTFCEAYARAVKKLDATPQPPAIGAPAGCFQEVPQLAFEDTVRILGRADLIRVDETFVKYSPGEISYVETVLAGEVRKREVKTTRYFEQTTERISSELSETAEETSVATQQELRTQVETELRTRFDSDISASANAAGGGTIGVVNVEGGAGVNASLGVGVDSSLSTSNESEFSQQIVNRALERTQRSVMERRATLSYALDETLNLHEIDNTIGTPKHRNGVYCFLNKHIRITETIYGERVFLQANVRLPGRNLLCASAYRRQLALGDLGARPVFDLSPADITPENYLALAGRYFAQNVEPPPAPITKIARTYKTDAASANTEQQELKLRAVADVLVPFFERYKRFLTVENVRLPEGYEVVDVQVTVSHGRNGVSVPAHLPLTVAGAAAYMGPAMAGYGAYGPLLIPYWLWSIGYLASPLLHYNADSSNVTVTVGNESQDSPYYFFQPDFLIGEVFDLLGSLSGVLPGILDQIQANALVLLGQLADNAADVPDAVRDAVSGAVDGLITQLRAVFDAITRADFPAMWTAFDNLTATVTTQNLQSLRDLMGDFFDPLVDFINEAIRLLDEGIGGALTDLFSFFEEISQNTQTLSFYGAEGARGELPVSLNTVAIKPGVTVNLTACLRRTDEALDAWRVRTFAALYQGYLQQLADWESRSMRGQERDGLIKPPPMLRQEERRALKELVMHALNNVAAPNGNSYTIDRMNLFEHAIDWENMSYRLFNYGPTAEEVVLEKEGLFAGADERRRAFLTAHWAQVLIPLKDDERLEEQVGRYFETGDFDFEGELTNDELVALYQELALARETVVGTTGEPRDEIVPTTFVVLNTDDLAAELPRNEALGGT